MAYQTGFASWAASGIGALPLSELLGSGFDLGSAALVFDPAKAKKAPRPQALHSRGNDNVKYCDIISPDIETGFPAFEAIPSWNARTDEGSWATIEVSARMDGVWSRWYDHGLWSAFRTTIEARSAAALQTGLLEGPRILDDPGRVATDTLILSRPAQAFRVRIRLFAAEGAEAPRLGSIALAWSSPKPAVAPETSAPAIRGCRIEGMPAWSQMIYPDGGNVWCSPTSLSMVMAYWLARAGNSLPDEETFIRKTVAGVYDAEYQGHGNWSFNVAWAGESGFSASVRRFSSLSELEPLVAGGQPLILSLSWDNEAGRTLSGAPLARSSGHLNVLVGFDEAGDPIVNEPAAPGDASVRRLYRRAEYEARWLEASGGATYIVGPYAGWA